jgi:Undecaprenyl-phosphate glucose phosphotransferase
METIDDLIARVRRDHIDTIVIAIPKLTRRRLKHIMESLRDVPVDVRVCPNSVTLDLTSSGVSHIAGLPLLNAIDRPLTNWRSATKEVEDRILASIILLLISPVLLAVAALIKIDSPGPVLFRQKRYGYNNQLITVFKFRTMRQDQQDDMAGQLTQRNDPRITRIGAFLRRTSLDELPQFLNVLRGEMSIVGPRPHAISAKAGGVLYHDAVSHYAARHRVKPGITGWAQINGWRGTTDTVDQIEKRVEHDLYYIEHWSLWLDLKIIVLTVFKGFSGQNAY